MVANRSKHGKILVLGVYVGLALFVCAEFHGLAPLLGTCSLHGVPIHGPTNDPTDAGDGKQCGLCVLVQSLVLVPHLERAEAPPSEPAAEVFVTDATPLWCDTSWSPETLRGPPLRTLS
jgi:hypothetical protein